VTREGLGRWIDEGHSKVDGCSCFSCTSSNQLQFSCVGANITSGVNARQTSFHHFVDGNSIDVHVKTPALQEVEVDNKANVDDDGINLEVSSLPVRLSKITTPLERASVILNFFQFIEGFDINFVALHLFNRSLHSSELISSVNQSHLSS
jgi:hypothetical protein